MQKKILLIKLPYTLINSHPSRMEVKSYEKSRFEN